jgi:hypothetical protein
VDTGFAEGKEQMTPLIAEMVGLIPDRAEHWTWFDIKEAWRAARESFTHDRSMKALQTKLPFPRCAVVAETENGPFLLMVSEALAINVDKAEPDKKLSVLAVAGVALNKNPYRQDILPLFSVDLHEAEIDKGITIHFEQPEHEKQPHWGQSAKNSLVVICFWLERMHTKEVKAYAPIANTSNPKRLRQGKKPLFDWHTVVLEPRSVKESEALGGTHSSPRQHDVRGHWVMRNNKRYWRKPHKRGDASLGVIFKDYQLKGERNADL